MTVLINGCRTKGAAGRLMLEGSGPWAWCCIRVWHWDLGRHGQRLQWLPSKLIMMSDHEAVQQPSVDARGGTGLVSVPSRQKPPELLKPHGISFASTSNAEGLTMESTQATVLSIPQAGSGLA